MKIQTEESNREYFSYQPVKEFTTKSGKKKHYQFKEQFSIKGDYMGILIATKPELIRFDFNLVELKKRRKKMKWIKGLGPKLINITGNPKPDRKMI